MCMVVIFPASKCRCSDARGASFVDPRLGRGLSMHWSAGSPRESITALTVCLLRSGVYDDGRSRCEAEEVRTPSFEGR